MIINGASNLVSNLASNNTDDEFITDQGYINIKFAKGNEYNAFVHNYKTTDDILKGALFCKIKFKINNAFGSVFNGVQYMFGLDLGLIFREFYGLTFNTSVDCNIVCKVATGNIFTGNGNRVHNNILGCNTNGAMITFHILSDGDGNVNDYWSGDIYVKYELTNIKR